jgi:hypothetical protein
MEVSQGRRPEPKMMTCPCRCYVTVKKEGTRQASRCRAVKECDEKNNENKKQMNRM